MKTIVSERGQITILKPLRRRLGIRAGQQLNVHEQGGKVTLTKSDALDPVKTVYGILKLGHSTDRLMAELRGKKCRR